jgi:3-oxoacyl-[acyl-carrier protein] reductase
MIDPGLAGRTALVTGAGTGIGAAVARALARQGATVVLHYLDGQQRAPREPVRLEHALTTGSQVAVLAREIEDAGGRCFPLAADLADPAAIARLFSAAEAEAGPVDVLVNNAAHCESPDTILELTPGTVDRHFAVNTRAPVLLVQELARALRRRGGQGGRVVNVSTDAARAFAGQIAYGASKAALEAFTRSMAVELGPSGITVNAVAPGPVQTGWITREIEERVVPFIPLGRVGSPEEVADAIVFLVSEQARWITGQVIQVSGGHAL